MSGIAFNTKNLSRLLLSNASSTIELGLTMLSETPVYVELMFRELWLIKVLNKNEALRHQADQLLIDALPQQKLEIQSQALQVFHTVYSQHYDKKVWHSLLKAYQAEMNAYDPLIQQNPQYLKAMMRLADRQVTTLESLSSADKDYHHPLFWYEKIIALNPKAGKAHFQLAHILHEKYFNRGLQVHRLSEAVTAYKTAITQDYYPDLCYHQIGMLYEDHRKDWRNAMAAYREALKINPGYAASLNRLSKIHIYQEKDYLKAWNLAEKALQIRPKNAIALITKGEILIEQSRDFHGAKNLYHQALSMDQFNPTVLNAMGDLYYFHFKAPEEARQFFDAAVQVAQDNTHALQMLNTINRDLGL